MGRRLAGVPFRSRTLNSLVVHDTLLELAQAFLGTDDLRCYMALITAKYPGQSSGFNQLLAHRLPEPHDHGRASR